ncbi:MAG: M24 family metallopeptidase [Candidatus Dormibacteraeota bacterium]|nr:M24 family metallopeptidase [Candidatus Dormibacteraeota bacterium]
MVTFNPRMTSPGLGKPTESREKLGRLRAAMKTADVDAVYLEGWANVAWLCGGRGNRVVLDTPSGQCAVLVGHNRAWLLTPSNEEARCRTEAFAGLDLPVISQPWYRLPLWQAARPLLTEGAHLAADVDVPGARPAEPLVAPLRQRLDENDVARFRALGQDAAEALEAAGVEARPDWSELEVAGTIAAALKAHAVEGAVVLVGCHARAERFRHLVPTEAIVDGGFTASITATRHGLHASCTRAVAFGPLPAELAERFDAIRDVDRALLRASVPGTALGELLEVAGRAYAGHGYYDEWKEHHQGGTTGYAGREEFALPGSDYRLEAGMAVAWNPTLPGAKSEDTFLVTPGGLAWLTRAEDSDWPLDEGDGGFARPVVREL